MLLTALGLVGWPTGLAYGLAFAVPNAIRFWTLPAAGIGNSQVPVDPGWADLLARGRPGSSGRPRSSPPALYC
ncbi:MAG: hypothetical protein U0800_21705 [Isosphaeraceae bacterium]